MPIKISIRITFCRRNIFLISNSAALVGILFSCSFASSVASAQIYNQPTEVITATPLSIFTERTGTWPSTEIPQDEFKSDVQPLADQLNSVPGLSARDSGSSTISIRGSVQADRVMKLYDGLPLNLADGVGGSDLFVPQEAIASAQILKMPASVFYGGSAMRGAIDYRTRLFDRAAIRLDAADDSGTFGTRGVFAAVPFRLKTSDDSATSRRSNYQFTAFNEEAPGRFHYDTENGLGSGRLPFNWSDTTRATLTGTSRMGQFEITPHLIFVQSNGETPGPLNSPSRSTYNSTGTLVAVDAKRKLDDDVTLDVRLMNLELDGKYDKGTSSATDSRTGRTAVSSDLDWQWAQRVQTKTFFDLNFDSFTASYVNDSHYSQQDFQIGQSHEIQLTDTLALIPAYRYLALPGQWLKTLTAQWSLNDARSWITYAEGFRLPSLSDRFSNTSYFVGNPSLKPERSQSVELGYTHEAGATQARAHDGISYGASIYAIRDTNLEDTSPLGGNAQTKINVGQARTYGAEASVGYSYHIWSATLAYNAMDGASQDVNGGPYEPLRLTPKNQATLIVSQQLGPVVFEAQDTYWSQYFDRVYPTNQLEALGPWNKFDLGIRTLGFTDWEIKAGVLNLFDQPRQYTWGYPEAQRRFYASVLRYF